MKKTRRNTLNKRKIILVVGILIFFFTSGLQWYKYNRSKAELEDLVTIKDHQIAVTSTFFPINPTIAKNKEDFDRRFSVAATSGSIVVGTVDKVAILRNVFTKEKLEAYNKSNPKVAQYYSDVSYDDYVKEISSYEVGNMPLFIYFAEPLSIGNQYKIVIVSKALNVWNLLLGSPKITWSFKVVPDASYPTARSFKDLLVEGLITRTNNQYFINEEFDYKAKCPVEYAAYNFNQEPEFTFRNDVYSFLNVSCEKSTTKGSEIESIKVEIHTKDFDEGKNIYKKTLSAAGFQESDKLRVEYIHKPK